MTLNKPSIKIDPGEGVIPPNHGTSHPVVYESR